MADDNPYDSPQSELTTEPSPRLLLWSVATVFASALIGGGMGLSIGAALGAFAPGYYRSVFSTGDSPVFDPVAVGIGQGLTQGIVVGGLIGLALVAMYYWFRARSMTNQT
ncbi:hypothetical protein SH528x_005590 [Novipirellula sp. SH528]|uniref:hypothetical protein n=1 Tax=Novipirellula sp. SH528 TaxID=3454466 RepID=UPI003F9F8983